MSQFIKIQNAINHVEGEIPLDLGATGVTGIHCSIVEKLREYYRLEKRPVAIFEPLQMLGRVDADLREAMGVDTMPFESPYSMFGYKNDNYREYRLPWGQVVLVPYGFKTTEKDGNIYLFSKGDDLCEVNGEFASSYGLLPTAMMPSGGFFFDILNRTEFDEDNYDYRDNLEEFTPVSAEALKYFAETAARLKNCGYYIVGAPGGTAIGDIALVPGPMLKAPKGIRGIEEWYISTVVRQDDLHKIFRYQTDMALKNLKAISEATDNTINAAFICGTDFGTQIGTFCSPETFKTLYMPYYKEINGWIHKNTKWKTIKHSCGSVESFFPLFIESGFDIINPVQWSAAGMDPQALKNNYGKDLVFWGGGVNTQKTLAFGTPDEVKKEVLHICGIFGKGGGFVFNPIHNIQARTPVQNIAAMLDALKEYNGDKFIF